MSCGVVRLRSPRLGVLVATLLGFVLLVGGAWFAYMCNEDLAELGLGRVAGIVVGAALVFVGFHMLVVGLASLRGK